MRGVRKFSKYSSLIVSEFRAWLLIGASIAVVVTVLVLLFAPIFDVREIIIRRQDPRVDLEDVQNALSPLFHERLLLVSRAQVSSLLTERFPDIERVAIDKTYPSTLTVTIFLEEIAAAVVIDDSDGSLSNMSGAIVGSGTYTYISKSGTFVSSPIKLTGSNPIPTLRLTDWGVRPQNRTPVLTQEMIERITSARDALRTDFGLSTVSVTVYVRAQEFHIRTNKVTLWFDLRSPLSVQFERFRQFLATLSLDAAKEYIDLRIADKIIYK